jgi:hypothetical protein
VIALTGQSAPGLPPGTVFADLSNNSFPEFNHAGQVAFLTKTLGADSASRHDSVFFFDQQQLKLVATESALAPGFSGGLIFDHLSTPSLQSRDHLVFSGRLADAGVTNNTLQGIWRGGVSETELVIRSGTHVPGLPPDTFFNSFQSPEVNRQGDIAFYGSVDGVEDDSAYFVLSQQELRRIVGHGDLAPVSSTHFPPPEIPLTRVFPTASLSDLGEVSFVARVPSPDDLLSIGPEGNSENGVWHFGEDGLTLLALAQQPLEPYVPERKLRFIDWQAVAFNNLGDTAFIVNSSLIDDSEIRQGIWLVEAGGATELLSRNDPIPGLPEGQRLGLFHEVSLGTDGSLAFIASVIEELTDTIYLGVFSQEGDEFRLVAESNLNTIGGPPLAVTEQLHFAQTNVHGRVAFFATTRTQDGSKNDFVSLWAENVYGSLTLIASEGESIETSPGVFQTIRQLHLPEQLLPFQDPPLYFNDLGQVLIQATFTDGTSGFFLSNLVAVPEPSTLILVALAGSLLTRGLLRR